MLNKFNVNRECHSPFIVRGSTLGTTNSLKFYIMGDPNSKEPFDSLEELLNFVMSKMPILKQRRVPRVPATTMDMWYVKCTDSVVCINRMWFVWYITFDTIHHLCNGRNAYITNPIQYLQYVICPPDNPYITKCRCLKKSLLFTYMGYGYPPYSVWFMYVMFLRISLPFNFADKIGGVERKKCSDCSSKFQWPLSLDRLYQRFGVDWWCNSPTGSWNWCADVSTWLNSARHPWICSYPHLPEPCLIRVKCMDSVGYYSYKVVNELGREWTQSFIISLWVIYVCDVLNSLVSRFTWKNEEKPQNHVFLSQKEKISHEQIWHDTVQLKKHNNTGTSHLYVSVLLLIIQQCCSGRYDWLVATLKDREILRIRSSMRKRSTRWTGRWSSDLPWGRGRGSGEVPTLYGCPYPSE